MHRALLSESRSVREHHGDSKPLHITIIPYVLFHGQRTIIPVHVSPLQGIWSLFILRRPNRIECIKWMGSPGGDEVRLSFSHTRCNFLLTVPSLSIASSPLGT